MLSLDSPEDREFIRFVWSRLPISLLYMEYQDFMYIKSKQQTMRKITNSDINRLELTLEMDNFIKLIGEDK